VRVFHWAALATSILGGDFDITIPDFTRDPLFKGPGDASGFGNFGLIEFVLRDKKIGRGLASIKSENAGQGGA
jgi:hypothetical protein